MVYLKLTNTRILFVRRWDFWRCGCKRLCLGVFSIVGDDNRLWMSWRHYKCDGSWQRDSLYLWSDKEHNEKCHSVYPGTSRHNNCIFLHFTNRDTNVMNSINFHIRCIIPNQLTLVGRCARYSGVMYLSLMLGTLVTLLSVSSTVITAALCSSESHTWHWSQNVSCLLVSHCCHATDRSGGRHVTELQSGSTGQHRHKPVRVTTLQSRQTAGCWEERPSSLTQSMCCPQLRKTKTSLKLWG